MVIHVERNHICFYTLFETYSNTDGLVILILNEPEMKKKNMLQLMKLSTRLDEPAIVFSRSKILLTVF